MASKHPSHSSPPQSLPPRVPTDFDELNRAICLLGNRAATDLKDKSKSELMLLIGTYPDAEQAKRWKLALKQLLKTEQSPSEHYQLEKLPKRSAQPKRRYRRDKDDRLTDFEERYTSGLSNFASIDVSIFRIEDEWGE